MCPPISDFEFRETYHIIKNIDVQVIYSFGKSNIVLVPYIGSALNMDTPNIFKCNTFYRHMAIRVHKAKQLKR